MPTDLTLDLDRLQRQGFPEFVYGQGKTREQTVAALRGLHAAHGYALATRVAEDLAMGGHYDPLSRIYRIDQMPSRSGKPCVISAGTSDTPVAEEAAQTLDFLGYQTQRIHDVGVAGLHRLLQRLDEIRIADVVIVVAGMEGALPSVMGGLLSQPIIAVPTSVGYGTSFQGIAALLGMLNSCSSGITVVNIDNGFGAALAAHRILNRP
jgi:pyridinium-3,5-biscarboxylic acid mononucleotide synthase